MMVVNKSGNVFDSLETAFWANCNGRHCSMCALNKISDEVDIGCLRWTELNPENAMLLLELRPLHDPNAKKVLRSALDTWGAEAQTLMVFEEMSELQKELCKHARGKYNWSAIAEEIADVRIMLDQMCILHHCEDAAEKYYSEKLARLRERVKEAGGVSNEGC